LADAKTKSINSNKIRVLVKTAAEFSFPAKVPKAKITPPKARERALGPARENRRAKRELLRRGPSGKASFFDRLIDDPMAGREAEIPEKTAGGVPPVFPDFSSTIGISKFRAKTTERPGSHRPRLAIASLPPDFLSTFAIFLSTSSLFSLYFRATFALLLLYYQSTYSLLSPSSYQLLSTYALLALYIRSIYALLASRFFQLRPVTRKNIAVLAV
jgi:hypothetical protein